MRIYSRQAGKGRMHLMKAALLHIYSMNFGAQELWGYLGYGLRLASWFIVCTASGDEYEKGFNGFNIQCTMLGI